MSSTQEIIASYYQSLKNRDRETLLSLLSPDMTVRYYGPEGLLPFIGEFHGVDGFDRFYAIVTEHFDIREVEQLAEMVDGNRLIVQGRGVWHCKATAKDIHANMVNIFTVDNGRISSYEVYNDTAAFAVGMNALGAVKT